jgi:hypothetical protein
LVRALYYLQFALGGPGYSVPLGLLLAGVSITAGFMRLLPRWVVACGLAIAVCRRDQLDQPLCSKRDIPGTTDEVSCVRVADRGGVRAPDDDRPRVAVGQ